MIDRQASLEELRTCAERAVWAERGLTVGEKKFVPVSQELRSATGSDDMAEFLPSAAEITTSLGGIVRHAANRPLINHHISSDELKAVSIGQTEHLKRAQESVDEPLTKRQRKELTAQYICDLRQLQATGITKYSAEIEL